MIPFTVDQYLEVFQLYNAAVWPTQLFLYALGILAISLALQRKAAFSKSISFILALFWIWMGLVYHLWFFSAINRAALIFAAFFVLQGILFFIAGALKNNLRFRFRPDLFGIIGSAFFVYALVILSGPWILVRPSISRGANFWSSLPDNDFYLRHVVLDRPPSSSLPLAYTLSLVVHWRLGSDLVGYYRGLRVVSRRIARIIADRLARQ